MPTIRTAAGKGAKLTPTEADTNMKRPVTAVTSTPITLTEAHNRNIIECGTGSGTLALAAAATLAAIDTEDWFVDIKNTTTSSVMVDGNGFETIDGATTLVIPAGQSARVVLNAAKTGFVTSGHKPLCALCAGMSAAQEHNSGNATYDVVVFDSETYDHAGANNTSTGQITVPTGYNFFKVYAAVGFASNATGVRVISLSATTSIDNYFEVGAAITAIPGYAVIATLSTGWIPISVTSSFYVLAYQSSDGNLAYEGSHSKLYVEFK